MATSLGRGPIDTSLGRGSVTSLLRGADASPGLGSVLTSLAREGAPALPMRGRSESESCRLGAVGGASPGGGFCEAAWSACG